MATLFGAWIWPGGIMLANHTDHGVWHGTLLPLYSWWSTGQYSILQTQDQINHMEVDKNTPFPSKPAYKGCMHRMQETFPSGLKCDLYPSSSLWPMQMPMTKLLNSRTLRHSFWHGVNQPHTSLPLYTILQAMMVAHWSATKLTQPLFHAISPMATKDGYLVQYLPQYATKPVPPLLSSLVISPPRLQA